MMNLKELYEACHRCTKCSLAKSRTNVVFGEGNLKSKIMFIGEGPGRDEDLQGRPFVGKAGQLLTKMIEAIDLKREDVFIANIVKCRPPNNRVPYPEEARECLPYLRNQVAIIRPKILVCLGATAGRYVIGEDMRITRDRGIWIERNGFYIIATFHPAALLRDPEKKKDSWQDLKNVRNKYKEIMQDNLEQNIRLGGM